MPTRPSLAQALWILSPGVAALRSETLAPPNPGEVRIRTLYSGISRGTESLVFHGRVPESQYHGMRAPFQQGDFPGPVKYGYLSVGVIEEGPPERMGETVFCLYPHQDHYCVPAEAALPLPPGVPAARAVLAGNLETALNALWDAAPIAGDRILVIGGGVVGLLVGWLCARIPGTTVTLVDPNPRRATLAATLGLEFAGPGPVGPPADCVIHASGRPEGLRLALESAAVDGTVCELSWYGDESVALPLGEAFHSRRLVLRSSQVGRVSPLRRGNWDTRRRLALTLRLLADPRLDGLITGESPFADAPETLAALAASPGDALCHRFRYP
jgi:NADPH:quinone reductase-like Zn-dependent oxidoreductase